MFKRRTYIISLNGQGNHFYLNGYGPLPRVGDTVFFAGRTRTGGNCPIEAEVHDCVFKPQDKTRPIISATVRHGTLEGVDPDSLGIADDGWIHATS